MGNDILSFGTFMNGAVGLAQIGTVIYLVRVVIAPMVEKIGSLSKTVETVSKEVDKHQDSITRINTIHQLRGCDTSNNPGNVHKSIVPEA